MDRTAREIFPRHETAVPNRFPAFPGTQTIIYLRFPAYFQLLRTIFITAGNIEYIYYQYNEKIYKVPTFGKIFKLIDFGRAIYKFENHVFCSDSFAPGDDAATQYNFEPYYNKSKPIIEPNMSFDLCRLGCSIYDFMIEIDDDKSKFNTNVPSQAGARHHCGGITLRVQSLRKLALRVTETCYCVPAQRKCLFGAPWPSGNGL